MYYQIIWGETAEIQVNYECFLYAIIGRAKLNTWLGERRPTQHVTYNRAISLITG